VQPMKADESEEAASAVIREEGPYRLRLATLDDARAISGRLRSSDLLDIRATSPLPPLASVLSALQSSERRLGPVDEVTDPQSGRCDKDEAEVAVGGLVVSCGQSAAVLEF